MESQKSIISSAASVIVVAAMFAIALEEEEPSTLVSNLSSSIGFASPCLIWASIRAMTLVCSAGVRASYTN